MKRLIFVSFGFLAFAFYQMSGGADFQPRVPSIPIAEAIQTTQAQPTIKPVTGSDKVKAASLIADTAVTPVKPIPAATEPATPVVFASLPQPAIEPGQTGSGQSQTTTAFVTPNPVAQPLVLASLEQGILGLRTPPSVDIAAPEPAVQAVTPADIREITATRVNMRDGPGTTFPVLTRLNLGDEVEILDEPGNGWLRLRTLPEQRVGWIAASLVSRVSR